MLKYIVTHIDSVFFLSLIMIGYQLNDFYACVFFKAE